MREKNNINPFTLYLFVVIIFFVFSCQKREKTGDELPIFGQKIVNNGDTVFHTIQNFELVDQDSNLVNNQTLDGKIYVADFMFTSCPTICPKMTHQMLRIYEKYKKNQNIQLVSHTIDPEHDNTLVLNEYASNLGIDPESWKFLTGDKSHILELAKNSYNVEMNDKRDEGGNFIHSGAFILVDKDRRIRGIYDGTNPNQVDILMADMILLLLE